MLLFFLSNAEFVKELIQRSPVGQQARLQCPTSARLWREHHLVGSPRLQAQGTSSGARAVDRVVDARKGANQILAVESACVDHSAQTRCHRQTARAHRARLWRVEAGTWSGTFRRPQLARLYTNSKIMQYHSIQDCLENRQCLDPPCGRLNG